jgi:hypothetical protein
MRSGRIPVPVAGAMILGLALAGSACVSTNTTPTGLISQSANMTADARQVISRIDEVTGLWLGAVEWRADLIRSSTDDPDIRRHALLWKMNATSAMLRATSHSDPLIAFMDAWTLVFQFKNYFEEGAGADFFGEHTEIARELSNLAALEFDTVAGRIATPEGTARGREVAAEFARREPIANSYFVRRSVADDLVEGLPAQTRSAFAEIGAITQTVESLNGRLSLYMAHLPKQARWQAELLLEDPTTSGKLAGALEDLAGIDATATRVADTLDRAVDDTVPAVVNEVLVTLHQEVMTISDLIDAQRRIVLEQLPNEYEEIFTRVSEQRIAALRDVETQLQQALGRVDDVVASAMTDAEGLTRGTVDYAFERATPLLIMAFFGLLILILVYRLVPQRVRTN